MTVMHNILHGLCIVLLLFCTQLGKHLFHCFLVFTSCIPCFGIILYPFNCSAFQSQLQGFLILHHNCYSVSSDKGYKERNKLVVILLPCLFFDGSSFYFFLPVTERCLQAILCFGWIRGSTQTYLQQPLSAAVTNGKWEWHLSILTSQAQNLLNHINAKWKRVASKAQYCNRKKERGCHSLVQYAGQLELHSLSLIKVVLVFRLILQCCFYNLCLPLANHQPSALLSFSGFNNSKEIFLIEIQQLDKAAGGRISSFMGLLRNRQMGWHYLQL